MYVTYINQKVLLLITRYQIGPCRATILPCLFPSDALLIPFVSYHRQADRTNRCRVAGAVDLRTRCNCCIAWITWCDRAR